MGPFSLILLLGCGSGAHSPVTQGALHLQGSVHGGQQPVSGASIQMYAAGTTGNGSPATPLISQHVLTDSSGSFNISGLYTCPSSDSVVYVVSLGGNPGLAAGMNNPSLALLAALGPCGSLTDSTFISVNEVTTVASLWPLAAYAESAADIGFASESAYPSVGTYIDSLVNIGTGTTPGPMLGASEVAPIAKLYTLADILAACINSSGGTAGDGSPCGQLFSYTSFGSAAPPTDTIAASIALAQNPTRNVSEIYDLLPQTAPFQPTLTSAPNDWTLPILSSPSAPSLSPGSGTYASGQLVSITDTTSGASIYYTLNGSTPSSSSALYTAPLTLTQSMTVNAIAIGNGMSSSTASAAYTVPVSVTLAPGSVDLSPSQTQVFSATVSGSTNTAVTWSLSPAVGSISSAGLYTAPATIASAQTVTVTATSAADPTKSASASVSLVPPAVTNVTYYLSPTGSDSNSGVSSSSPWLTPNHPLKCGDVIMASASSAYSYKNFGSGKWGTVTCAAGNNVAWLTCATFDACKISAGANFGIEVTASYWGVQGWEVTTSSSGYNCFSAASISTTIHHIIFANDIANGCGGGGLGAFNTGTAGVDYLAIVGSIAYNAAQGSTHCTSGISVYQPVQSDAVSGTHIYVAGNFSFGNLNPDPCDGTAPTDGEGGIFDTFDGSQAGFANPYSAQAVMTNNIFVANGGRGMEVQNNSAGSSHAPIYLEHNTLWSNSGDPNQSTALCADVTINVGQNIQVLNNLVQTTSTMACSNNRLYGMYVYTGGTSDVVSSDFVYAASGLPTGSYASGSFAFGSNTTASLPSYAAPAAPAAPACGSYASVPACMATVIANFTPTNSSAKSYGYQVPTGASVNDPLFPQWLCNVKLPSGLVAMGCSTATSASESLRPKGGSWH